MICKTCFYWDLECETEKNSNCESHPCKREPFDIRSMKEDDFAIICGHDGFVFCGPKFGCVHWKELMTDGNPIWNYLHQADFAQIELLILARSIPKIEAEIKSQGLKSKIFMQLHDEIVFKVVLEEEDKITAILKSVGWDIEALKLESLLKG